MATTQANNAYVAMGTAGTESTVTTNANSADLKRMADQIDSTTFGSNDKTFIPGLKDSSFTFNYDWDSAIDGILAGLLAVAGKSLVFGPAGNATGKVKYSVGGFLQDYGISGQVAGKLQGTATWRPSGAVTVGVF